MNYSRRNKRKEGKKKEQQGTAVDPAMEGNAAAKMTRNADGNAKCRTRRIRGYESARAHAPGDGVINYSSAFTLACNSVLMHIGTALSWVCARAPRIRLRCFSRDAVDPHTRARARATVARISKDISSAMYRHCGYALVLLLPPF